MDNGWISVNDRLPEDSNTVLVAKKLKNGSMSVDFGRYFERYTVYDRSIRATTEKPLWETRGNSNVMYWMPIPKVPEV